MKKQMVIAIVAVLVILALLGGYIVTRNRSTSNYTVENMNMSPNGNSSANTTTPVATNAVTIQNMAFAPASITVKKGTQVTWTNKDGIAHTVTETDGQTGPDSGDVAPSSSYSFTYNTVGTFHYHCAIHPSMTGTVTVTE